MIAKEFPQQNIVIAENQDEYNSLPALVSEDGAVTCCFQLDEAEIKQVKETGEIWLTVLTFGRPLQPINTSVLDPFVEAKPDQISG